MVSSTGTDKYLGVEIQYIQLLCVNEKTSSILNFKTLPCNICNFHLFQQQRNEADKAVCATWDEEIANI